MPVIPLKDVESLDEEMKGFVKTYDEWIGDTVYARFMSRIPKIFKKFNDLYAAMLEGEVESDLKELARLRLARQNRCEY